MLCHEQHHLYFFVRHTAFPRFSTQKVVMPPNSRLGITIALFHKAMPYDPSTDGQPVKIYKLPLIRARL